MSEAARVAPVNRETWTGIERGTQRPNDATYAKIERVLHWEPGSATAILDGGDPKDGDIPPERRSEYTAIDQWEAELVRDIRADRRLSPEQKLELVKQARQTAVQQRAALQEAELERSALEQRVQLLRSRRAG